MTNKQALREAAQKAAGAYERLSGIPADDIFDISLSPLEGDQLDADITALNAFNESANPGAVLALLDELEAEKERSENLLRQARSFREAHESAAELIRRMERSKPEVILPATRLWADKVPCFEAAEVISMLNVAGIRINGEG